MGEWAEQTRNSVRLSGACLAGSQARQARDKWLQEAGSASSPRSFFTVCLSPSSGLTQAFAKNVTSAIAEKSSYHPSTVNAAPRRPLVSATRKK